MSNWISIYKTDSIFTAEVMVNKLQAEGIYATILNQRDTAYSTFGTIHIRVPQEYQQQAMAILQLHYTA